MPFWRGRLKLPFAQEGNHLQCRLADRLFQFGPEELVAPGKYRVFCFLTLCLRLQTLYKGLGKACEPADLYHEFDARILRLGLGPVESRAWDRFLLFTHSAKARLKGKKLTFASADSQASSCARA